MNPYLTCSQTGEPALNPVVFKPTGDIYESSVINTYLLNHKKCPKTSQEMAKDDLQPLVCFKGPRLGFTHQGSSVYSQTDLVLNKYKEEVLSTKELLRSINENRTKLAKALKKQDAALRIIKRLKEERDDARTNLTKIICNVDKKIISELEKNIGKQGVMTEDLGHRISQFAIRSTDMRKKRETCDTKIIQEIRSEFEEYKKDEYFTAAFEGRKFVQFHPNNDDISYVFDNTGDFMVYDTVQKKEQKFENLNQGEITCFSVNQALCSPSNLSLTIGSSNGSFSIRNFNHIEGSSSTLYSTSEKEEEAFVSIEEHPSKTLQIMQNESKYFNIFDLNSERITFRKQFDDDLDIKTLKIHPDGRLLALGGTVGNIHLWDLKSNSLSITFQTEKQNIIDQIDFNNNGYLAVCGSTWSENFETFDLRNPKQYLERIETSEELVSLKFSQTGRSLLCGMPSLIRAYSCMQNNRLTLKSTNDQVDDGLEWFSISSLPNSTKMITSDSSNIIKTFNCP